MRKIDKYNMEKFGALLQTNVTMEKFGALGRENDGYPRR